MPRPTDDLTPEQLLAAAESLEREAQLLRELAKLRSGVNVNPRATVSDGMTPQQLLKRGKAIALAKVGDDPLLLAIAGSQWGSAAQYAKRRLRVTPASLTQWHGGRSPVPSRVERMVREDFGLHGPKIWPKGVA